MTRAAQLAGIIDAEILEKRARHAVALAAERARIAHARQSRLDAATVQAREARVLASRGRAIVRSLVEP